MVIHPRADLLVECGRLAGYIVAFRSEVEPFHDRKLCPTFEIDSIMVGTWSRVGREILSHCRSEMQSLVHGRVQELLDFEDLGTGETFHQYWNAAIFKALHFT